MPEPGAEHSKGLGVWGTLLHHLQGVGLAALPALVELDLCQNQARSTEVSANPFSNPDPILQSAGRPRALGC